MAPQGAVCILGDPFLHPTAALLLWLFAILAAQSLGYAGLLALIAGALALAGKGWRKWLAYVRRVRWLVLTLWLIMAYNTAGEAYFDLVWAPTYEGVGEANLNVVRLLALLACVACLFARLGRDGLLIGLWGALTPLRRFRFDVERLVVRLSLVLDELEDGYRPGEWKKMLEREPLPQADGVLQLEVAHWRAADGLLLGCGLMILLGLVVL